MTTGFFLLFFFISFFVHVRSDRFGKGKRKKKVQFETDTDSSSWSVTGLSTKCQNPGEGRVTLRWTVISLTREGGRSVAVILIA